MLLFLLETFALGLKNLRLHKLRSLLTALGIIFGVASVEAMVSISKGAETEALARIQALGVDNIIIRSQKPAESGKSSSNSNRSRSYTYNSGNKYWQLHIRWC